MPDILFSRFAGAMLAAGDPHIFILGGHDSQSKAISGAPLQKHSQHAGMCLPMLIARCMCIPVNAPLHLCSVGNSDSAARSAQGEVSDYSHDRARFPKIRAGR